MERNQPTKEQAKLLAEGSAEAVLAIVNKGSHPEYHDAQLKRLKTEWPTLHKALEKMAAAVGVEI